MRNLRPLAAMLAFGLFGLSACVAGGPAPAPSAAANPVNVLDTYVARPDPSFAWKVDHTFTGAGYHGAVIDLTSQTWLTAAQTDRSVWKHWLTVTVPDALTSSKAFLYIMAAPTTGRRRRDRATTWR